MWTEEDRRELVALFAEDDRQRREHAAHCAWFAEWMGQRTPPVGAPDDAGMIHRSDDSDALYGAPEPEDEGPAFSERQADAIAEVVHQLRREFQDGVERMQQRILDVMVRAALPGELAEQGLYDLRNRVALAEQRIERRIAAAVSDDDDNVLDLPSFLRRRHDPA